MLLWVPGRLPGLNELLSAKSTRRGSWNSYNDLKCQWYGQIKLLVMAKRIGLQPPGYATFLFVEPSRARDPDNVVAGGCKLLFDSLVGAGVLSGDGWRDNLGFVGYWTLLSGRAGCLVYWDETGLASKAIMLELLEKELKNGDGSGASHHQPGNQAARKAGPRGARARRQLPQR